jgi:hypothetical protein
VRLAGSMLATMSRTTFTPWRLLRLSYGVVMSAMVLWPPITRLEMGQETKAALGSTRVTSMP